MNKINTIGSFLLGVSVGAFGAWCYLNETRIKHSEEDIESVKESYRKRCEHCNRIAELEAELNSTLAPSNEVLTNKEDIREFVKGRRYSNAYVPEMSQYRMESSYVISPDEFGEEDDYAKVSLTYFADDVLTDDNGIVIEDPEEIIGDALEHFGEYEDDSVFCRNDPKRCDYEILKDLRRYADVSKSLPPNR